MEYTVEKFISLGTLTKAAGAVAGFGADGGLAAAAGPDSGQGITADA